MGSANSSRFDRLQTLKIPTRGENSPATLPVPLAPLVGRDNEISELHTLLLQNRVRLLTLTGTGGTGKTRLALEVAARVAGAFTHTYSIDLTAVRVAQDVSVAIAEALGLRENASEPLLAAFQGFFTGKSCLLVLDNFEHVLGASSFVADLVATCPTLVFLVTSREALNLRSERVYFVEPLPVPDVGELVDVDAIRGAPSVTLFEERARARRASFRLTDVNATAVAEICVRLDGLPLAIELAAAQADVLEPAAILRRLRARSPFVSGGPRDLPPRHATLDSTIGWSYDLLEPEQRAVFRACGVFVGSFSVEGLDAVRNGTSLDADNSIVLAQLVTKSLLRVAEDGSSNPRFYLLQTIRDFARDQLAANGELQICRSKHAAYCVALAETLQPDLRGPAMAAAFDRLAAEYGNFRAVFQWATESGDLASGLRLAGALYRFWIARGHLSEAREWLEAALARPEPVPSRVRGVALNAAGVMAGIQHDHERAVRFLEESLQVWERLRDSSWQAHVYLNLGLVAWGTARLEEARQLFERAQELYVEVGDLGGQANAVGNRALVAREREDLPTAKRLLGEALVLFRATGDTFGLANTLANLGWVALALGDRAAAAASFSEALQLRRAHGNTAHIAECFEGLAAVSTEARPRRSTRLLGAAEALRETSGAPMAAADQSRYERLVEQLRRRVRPDTFASAWREGREQPLEHAIELALREEVSVRPDVLPTAGTNVGTRAEVRRLSRREREIAQLIARGQSNREIAEELVVSINTVETHVKHVFKKLDISSRAEIAAWAAREGLI